MPNFKVLGCMTVSCWTNVEARSEEEAIRIAKNREPAEHHIDGSFEDDECWHFDNDGSPHAIYVESDN